MRILVLNYEFPPVGGGGGRFCQDLCCELARSGHEVRVQTVHFRGLPGFEVQSGYAVYRSRSCRMRAHTCSVAEMAAFLTFNLLPSWRHAVNWRPDVIHAHFAVPTGVLGWLLRKATGIPYVISTQLGDVPGALPDQTDHLFRWIKPFTVPIWRDAAAVTAPSEHIRRIALHSYNVAVHILPNGADISSIQKSPLARPDPPRMVFAGRFNAQKNLLFLVETLRKVSDLPWHMEFVGDGPVLDAVKHAAQQNGLKNRVNFHGWVSPDTVHSIMSRCDVLLIPSLYEGLPVVGLWALVAGLAIVGSDIGGITELIEHGRNGFLCPPGDADAFEQSLRALLGSGSDGLLAEMKGESRKLADRYDIRAIAREFERLLSRCI